MARHARDHDPAELFDTDLLFVGGGNTFGLLEHVSTHGFLEPVRRFVAEGGDYYGGSAGAVLACLDIEIATGHDPNDVGLHDLSALGLVSGFTVLPHFTEEQLGSTRRWSAQRRTTVLGIPERSGVLVRDGHVQVAGPDSVWQVSADTVTVWASGERRRLPAPADGRSR